VLSWQLGVEVPDVEKFYEYLGFEKNYAEHDEDETDFVMKITAGDDENKKE